MSTALSSELMWQLANTATDRPLVNAAWEVRRKSIQREVAQSRQLNLFQTGQLSGAATIRAANPRTLDYSAAAERSRTRREIVLHHWECTVTAVGDETFLATLRSLRDPRDSDKEAEIPIDDVTTDDLELLEPGAIFYWMIGYEITPGGTRKRTSQLVFRRLPAWSKRDMQRLEDRAKELFARFGEPGNEGNAAGG